MKNYRAIMEAIRQCNEATGEAPTAVIVAPYKRACEATKAAGLPEEMGETGADAGEGGG